MLVLNDSKLKTKTAREKLAPRWKPYAGPSLARGVQLLYRRNKDGSPGTWVVKAANGAGAYWTKRVGEADDVEPANGSTVLSLHEAKEKALALANGGNETLGDKPMTVGEALARYEQDLEHRGRDANNAARLLKFMPRSLLGKPVGALTGKELREWRDGLANHISPASINRTRVGLRAALRLAAGLDPRITNHEAWRIGLKSVRDSNRARDILLPSVGDVMKIVDAAYEESEAFGLLVHVLAETGCRKSQAFALDCYHLQRGTPDRLLMPASFKGKKTSHRHHEPVVISDELAGRLARARQGREDNAPLLLNRQDVRWGTSNPNEIRDAFRRAVQAAGLDPDKYTSYCLRHSHIVAQLELFPAMRVAKWHDTSVAEIERHYAKFVNKSDRALEMAKAALPRRAGKVVQLRA